MGHGILLACLILLPLFVVCGVIYPAVMSLVWLVRWRGIVSYKQFMREI